MNTDTITTDYTDPYDHLMERNKDLFMTLVTLKFVIAQIEDKLPQNERETIEKLFDKIGL